MGYPTQVLMLRALLLLASTPCPFQWHSGSTASSRTGPTSAHLGSATMMYGFHLQAHRNGWATIGVVETIRSFYTHEKIFVVTDDCNANGGFNYSSACAYYGCHWSGYADAAGYGQRAGSTAASGLQWLKRVMRSMKYCDCKYLINMEDDTCILRKILYPPPVDGVVGGVPWPKFNRSFVEYAHNVSGKVQDGISVWGCAGGCYFKTQFWLQYALQSPKLWTTRAVTAARAAGAEVQFMDVIGPALAMLGGGSVRAWVAVSEGGRGENVARASIKHKCDSQLALRKLNASSELWTTCSIRKVSHGRGLEEIGG